MVMVDALNLTPPPAVPVWIGGRWWWVRTWLGVEGPGPPGSVRVRGLVWQTYEPDAGRPGPSRRGDGPGRDVCGCGRDGERDRMASLSERAAFARWPSSR